MARIIQSAPWRTYINEVEELFKYDREVHCIYHEQSQILNIYVENNPLKAAALIMLFPVEVKFGNIEININIISSVPLINPSLEKEDYYFLLYAFERNPILSYIDRIKGIEGKDLIYVVFVKRIVQYFDNNITNIDGIQSTLYQEIAKHVFKPMEGVYYCTDKEIDTFDEVSIWP